VRPLLAFTLLETSPYHCMVLRMLTRQGVLMIKNLLVITSSFLAPLLSHENLVSNALLLAPPLKALADGTVEVLWLHYLLSDLCFSPNYVTIIWCDNLGATYLSANSVFHARTIHVEVDYHFVRDRVAKKEIHIHFIPSKDKLADVLTKPLPHTIFFYLRSKL